MSYLQAEKWSPLKTQVSLPAGQSTTLILRFTPSSVGEVQGSVSVDSNGGSETITLSGEGIEGAALGASPTTLNFGGVRVGSSKDLLLTVQVTMQGLRP